MGVLFRVFSFLFFKIEGLFTFGKVLNVRSVFIICFIICFIMCCFLKLKVYSHLEKY